VRVAVVLQIQVQNQLHEVVRELEEAPGEPFLEFCRLAADMGVRYVEFIWPYQDSMLNPFQLGRWLEDFPKALEQDTFTEEQRESALRVLDAAREAESLDGYLLFEA
jgi:hypothetical protein